MQRIELNLAISAQEYQRFYRGQVKQVVALSAHHLVLTTKSSV